jgi:serine/threonine-protein kinase
VSPQNILLSTGGEVKIADFGIAKFIGREESTATGMIRGKFAYMSPEQASAAPIDRRSDVFALGIVLWEALLLKRLFHADTPARTLLRVMEHVPGKPAALRPEVGDEISNIVMRCLAKNPNERFATAADLADALRSALRSRRASVDESDLTAAVKRFFGDERRATMDRLQSGPLPDDGTTRTWPGPSPEASAAVAVSLSTPRPKRSLPVRAVGIGAALVAFGAVAVWRALPAAQTPPTTSAIPVRAPAVSGSASMTTGSDRPRTSAPSQDLQGVPPVREPPPTDLDPVQQRRTPPASLPGSAPTAVGRSTSRGRPPSDPHTVTTKPAKPPASAPVPPPSPTTKPTGGQPFESL